MIIDLILDRQDDDKRGFAYIAKSFYLEVLDYARIFPDLAFPIAKAMDEGTNTDVQNALCDYIDSEGYNPEIKKYINSRKWI